MARTTGCRVRSLALALTLSLVAQGAPRRSSAQDVVQELPRSCESTSGEKCPGGGAYCEKFAISSCELERARELEAAKDNPEVIRATYQAAMDAAWAAVDASLTASETLAAFGLYHEAVLKRLKYERLKMPVIKRNLERLEKTLADPKRSALKSDENVRNLQHELEAMRDIYVPADEGESALLKADATDARESARVSYRAAAEHFREARRRARTRDEARYLFGQEFRAWDGVRRNESPGECRATIKEMRSEIKDVTSEGDDGAGVVADREVQLVFESGVCDGEGYMVMAKSCKEDDYSCRIDRYVKAADKWEKTLREAEMGKSRAFARAFPYSSDQNRRLIDLAKMTVDALILASTELRAKTGWATSQGRVYENRARRLLDWAEGEANRANDAVLRGELERIEVHTVKGKILYPEGHYALAGGGMMLLGLTSIALGAVELSKVYEACNRVHCGNNTNLQSTYDAGTALAVVGSVAVTAGVVLVGVGVSKLKTMGLLDKRRIPRGTARRVEWRGMGVGIQF